LYRHHTVSPVGGGVNAAQMTVPFGSHGNGLMHKGAWAMSAGANLMTDIDHVQARVERLGFGLNSGT